MKQFLFVLACVMVACGGSVQGAEKPDDDGCEPYSYAKGAEFPLYPCDDDPRFPHGGPQYRPVVVDGAMTCQCR